MLLVDVLSDFVIWWCRLLFFIWMCDCLISLGNLECFELLDKEEFVFFLGDVVVILWIFLGKVKVLWIFVCCFLIFFLLFFFVVDLLDVIGLFFIF